MSESRRLKTMCPMNCHPTFCGMEVEVQDDRVLSIRGDADNPDSHGFLCIRGQASREIVDNPLRVLRSRMREARRDDAWRDASWYQALDRIAGAIRTAGPDVIRIFNDRGAMQARAQVTERVPAGVVWMHDGWTGINTLTNGGRAVPDAAAKAFPGGQAAYEARVEVSSSGH